jgi:DNA-binding GntR family transcriptional regulator
MNTEGDWLMKNSKIPLTDEAYNKIKKLIINLHFRPGEVIFTQQLASELNISRTPTREALVKLAQEGLLTRTDSRKFQVAEVNEDYITDLYDLRECFETTAVTQIFSKINQKDIDILENQLSEMNKALMEGDVDKFFNLDNHFHNYFVNLYNNKLMISFMNQLMDKQQRIRYITFYISNRMNETINEHRQILDGIKEGNLDSTIRSIHDHLEIVKKLTIEFINNKNSNTFMRLQTI